jgi:hypothetical protein
MYYYFYLFLVLIKGKKKIKKPIKPEKNNWKNQTMKKTD